MNPVKKVGRDVSVPANQVDAALLSTVRSEPILRYRRLAGGDGVGHLSITHKLRHGKSQFDISESG